MFNIFKTNKNEVVQYTKKNSDKFVTMYIGLSNRDDLTFKIPYTNSPDEVSPYIKNLINTINEKKKQNQVVTIFENTIDNILYIDANSIVTIHFTGVKK